MTHNEKAAIIGYHLSGAPIEQIIVITGTSYQTIENIINEYVTKR